MDIAIKSFSRFLLVLGLVSFLLAAFIGPSHTMVGMEPQSDGSMGGCLFTGMEDICLMTFAEHLLEWQNLFAVTGAKDALALVLFLAVLFVSAFVFKRHLLLRFSYYVTRWRQYLWHHPDVALFPHLREVFSQGILHPKIS